MSVLAICALGFCWAMGLWTASMQTIALVLVAVAISVAIAFRSASWRRATSGSSGAPAGARRDADGAAWVYLIPAVIFFSLGRCRP